MSKKRNHKKSTTFVIGLLVFIVVISVITILSTNLFAATSVSNSTTYTILNDWGGGATANVTIYNNNSYAITNWTLSWTYPGDQQISSIWGAACSQNGSTVSTTPPSWNPTIPANGTASFGFMISYTGTNSIPTSFSLSGSAFGITSFTESSSSTNTKTTISQLTWTSSDQWGKLSTEGYTLYNNIWGGGAGTQTIWAKAFNNWGINANHPNTGGIKSYPNCEREVNKKLSALNSCTSTFNCTVPSSGAYNTAYDVWCNNYTYEIMLWMNWKGAVGPIARSWDSSGNPVPEYTNVSIGGHTWNIYKGTNGVNQVYSFLRTSQTNSGTVDIKAVCDWIKSVGWYDDVTLYKVQLGWEITSSSGGLNFSINDYSVSYN